MRGSLFSRGSQRDPVQGAGILGSMMGAEVGAGAMMRAAKGGNRGGNQTTDQRNCCRSKPWRCTTIDAADAVPNVSSAVLPARPYNRGRRGGCCAIRSSRGSATIVGARWRAAQGSCSGSGRQCVRAAEFGVYQTRCASPATAGARRSESAVDGRACFLGGVRRCGGFGLVAAALNKPSAPFRAEH